MVRFLLGCANQVTSPFAQVSPSLIAGGYSPIPIGVGTKYPARYEPTASEDGRDWWPLKNWHVFCARQAHPAIIAQWSTWPDAGGGLACGFGGLVAVDIDDASLIEPLLAVLPPVLVAKRGRRGLTVFYRATEPLPSKNYRAQSGGLLDFLSNGKQTVAPPSIHPDTGEPYYWTTARTLLDTPLVDLPAFTREHFVAMEDVLRAYGWDTPEPKQPLGECAERPARSHGTASGFADDLNAAALANLSAWVPGLGLPKLRPHGGGYRAVAPWRASGSGRSATKRGANLGIHPTGIRDFGSDDSFSPVGLVAKALNLDYGPAAGWLREKFGLPDAPLIELRNGASRPTVEPSYPDNRVSLAEAEAAVAALVGDAFEKAILEWRTVRNQIALKPLLALQTPPVLVGRIETGIGKTRAAITAVASFARRRMRIVYAVQRHDLADAVATQFAAQGIKAQVYRGYDRTDPLAPDHLMCRNLPAYEAARDLGVGIRAAVCERRIDEKVIRCKFADVCGRERQREATPQVWIVPTALLPLARPEFVFDGDSVGTPLDAIVIDERFHDNAIGKPQSIAIPTLARSKIEGCDKDESAFLSDMRQRLLAATEANDDGPLSRVALDAQVIRPDFALRASYLEQRVCSPNLLRPDMGVAEVKAKAYHHKARTQLARAAGALWEEIALFLAFDHPKSGRLSVSGDKIMARPLRWLHSSWSAPTLVLDATAPNNDILAAALFGGQSRGLPSPPITAIDISARWPDHVHIRQLVCAPVTMAKLGLYDGPRPQNELDVLRFIRQRAALAAPAKVGLITYKGLRDRVEDRLPANVIVRHFGATSGTNDMEGVGGLILIGRQASPRVGVEAGASVLAGYPVGGGSHHFEQVTGGIRLADGGAVHATASRHPEALAEDCRWQVTEAELLQAVGRLRPHRRAAPCWLDIVCDVPLPLPVHEVVVWSAPGAVADMVAAGVLLTNSRDAMTAFGLSKRAAEEVGGCPQVPKESPIRCLGATSPVRKFGYRKSGPGQKNNEGYFLPHVLKGGEAALREWLEEKLGPLASLDVERGPATAVFERIGWSAAQLVSKFFQPMNVEDFDETEITDAVR
jgi:hypothetical protein